MNKLDMNLRQEVKRAFEQASETDRGDFVSAVGNETAPGGLNVDVKLQSRLYGEENERARMVILADHFRERWDGRVSLSLNGDFDSHYMIEESHRDLDSDEFRQGVAEDMRMR